MGIDEARVTLRAFTAEDLPAFLEWATDDEVTRWVTWDSYASAEDALRFLQTVAVPHPWLKAVCVDGRAAGSVVVERGRGVDACRGVLGYCLARKHWGAGVATAAVKQMVAMAFQGIDITRIDALVDQRNVASRRVLEKAGFTLEATMFKYLLVKGTLLDCFLFANYNPLHS